MWSGCVPCGNGALQHLPNTIQLGAFRGSVFYPGQPKECRKCGSLDHLAAACTMDVCRNCKALDHTTAHCPTPVKCNLCSSANHRFKDCPQAYSNRLKLCLLIDYTDQRHVEECRKSGKTKEKEAP
uniref:CCHC-type domain-containing protein n=1 Tax=Sparus aurata TaxID=8175 RepID=A0A671WGV7_SPAAU